MNSKLLFRTFGIALVGTSAAAFAGDPPAAAQAGVGVDTNAQVRTQGGQVDSQTGAQVGVGAQARTQAGGSAPAPQRSGLLGGVGSTVGGVGSSVGGAVHDTATTGAGAARSTAHAAGDAAQGTGHALHQGAADVRSRAAAGVNGTTQGVGNAAGNTRINAGAQVDAGGGATNPAPQAPPK